MNKLVYELFHITLVEFIRLTIIYVLVPIAICIGLWLLFLKKLLDDKLKAIRKKIVSVIIKKEFETIFNAEAEDKLDMQYITNALKSSEKANDLQTRITALQQLAHFSHEIARDGLIKILSKEKDVAIKHMIIKTLNKIVINLNNKKK
ncbi:hypothetical protein [Geobacter sp.]|uniref:hypothetical protein n=1 Tax=Geobacter sp. TaxID=46610 RepID=UPI0027B8C691|nr:hypothetical protein [Geobacter sp.]